ncbi:MAG TPA: hydrogenase nickel incorporation protein HypB [Phycisphaerae bacterium]|nr:hydrogenase nickel incorporation protein HypB [Phycisphaerae bacterium]
MTRRIPLEKKVLSENDRLAAELALRFGEADVFVVNLMSSPGAGKTSLLEETAKRLGSRLSLAAVEGDLATDRDAERLRKAGLPARQINTGRGCHLNAAQVTEAVVAFDLAALDVLFIENVGNLVCPAAFYLGEHRRVVVSSTPEGDDKPVKYPVAFHSADCVVLNKMDLVEAAGFSLEAFRRFVRGVAPRAPILELSCRTGAGLETWLDWLTAEREAARTAAHTPE